MHLKIFKENCFVLFDLLRYCFFGALVGIFNVLSHDRKLPTEHSYFCSRKAVPKHLFTASDDVSFKLALPSSGTWESHRQMQLHL